jgi:hypothetical protein
MSLTLYADDLDAQRQLDELLADGVVSFSEEEHCWVASIDWSAIHHATEEQTASAHGLPHRSEKSANTKGRTSHCTEPGPR